MSPTDKAVDVAAVDAAVSLRDVSMAFGGKTVLASVSLDIAPGSVVALLGANGAGKSTLIKILSGVHTDHGGEVRVAGEPAALQSPSAARQLGIQTVHQRIGEGIVPGLTVAENLVFEELAQRRGNPFLNGRRVLARAREIQAGLELDWSDAVLRRDVTELGISDRQLLILARALATRPRLLILDEPTSALSAAEAERLFALVEKMRDDGIAVLYVSHRLGEIDALADRLVVLRDGGLTDDQVKPFDWDSALRAMLAQAHEATSARPQRSGEHGDVVLALHGVHLFEGRTPLDLDLRAGEVTGVVGLLGAYKTELARGLFGAEPFPTGTVELDGKPYAPRRPSDAIRRRPPRPRGPARRRARPRLVGGPEHLAAVPQVPVPGRAREHGEGGRPRPRDHRRPRRRRPRRTQHGRGALRRQPAEGRRRPLARRDPRVLILDEPFRGVDIGARRDIGRRARALAAEGAAVLVLSADVDEVLEIADRVVVLAAGEVHLDAYGEDAERDRVIQTISASV